MGPHVSGRVRGRLDLERVVLRAVALLCLALGVAIAGCRPGTPPPATELGDSIVVVDAEGLRRVFRQPARRIISLVPSATATLRAIGADQALVGRTDYDTQEWAMSLPSVGGGLQPSLEAIVALEPDLVIRFAGSQDPRTRSRLDQLGIAYVTVRPDRIEDIFETAQILGRVTGRVAAADSLVHFLRQGLRETSEAVSGWPRLRVAYVLGGSPPWVSGPETYISEVLALVGGDNVFSDLDALYSAISPEVLRTRQIDVVLVATRGEYDEGLTPGARVQAIGNALEIPGPEVVEAARRVAELLHGRPLR